MQTLSTDAQGQRSRMGKVADPAAADPAVAGTATSNSTSAVAGTVTSNSSAAGARAATSNSVISHTKATMAAVVRGAAAAELRWVARPRVQRDDDLVVQVAVVGLCRTDLDAAAGLIRVSPGLVLGHECAGRVADAGDAVELRPGQRVTVMPVRRCGACAACGEGDAHLCVHQTMLGLHHDGAFAEFVRVPASDVRPLADHLSLREGAYWEPVAAALGVMNAGMRPGDRVLILGVNRFAELTRQVLAAHGVCDVALSGAHVGADVGAENEASGDAHVGADVVLSDAIVNAPDEAGGGAFGGDPFGGDGDGAFDFVIETCPTAAVIARACRAARPRGTVVLKSRSQGLVGIDLAEANRKELTLRAVRYGPFDESLRLLTERRIAVGALLGPEHELRDFADAFAAARGDETSKHFFRVAE